MSSTKLSLSIYCRQVVGIWRISVCSAVYEGWQGQLASVVVALLYGLKKRLWIDYGV